MVSDGLDNDERLYHGGCARRGKGSRSGVSPPLHPTHRALIHRHRALLPLLSMAVSLLLLPLHPSHLPIQLVVVVPEDKLPRLVVRLSRMPLPLATPPFSPTPRLAELVLYTPVRLHILWPTRMLPLEGYPRPFLL